MITNEQRQTLMNVQDVADVLRVSVPQAYRVIRDMNHELEEKGLRTIRGKVPEGYLMSRFFEY